MIRVARDNLDVGLKVTVYAKRWEIEFRVWLWWTKVLRMRFGRCFGQGHAWVYLPFGGFSISLYPRRVGDLF